MSFSIEINVILFALGCDFIISILLLSSFSSFGIRFQLQQKQIDTLSHWVVFVYINRGPNSI